MSSYESYIICATPRSGSTLLCDLMHATGVAGRPDSFFQRGFYSWWAEHLGLPYPSCGLEAEFQREYLTSVIDYGTNGTTIFGMRLMWESVTELSNGLAVHFPSLPNDKARLEAAFGKSLYIHLSRENKIEQAISLYRATESGLWHRFADGTERERLKSGKEPTYNAIELSKFYSKLEKQDNSWVSWFAEQDVEPLCLTYEDLSLNHRVGLVRVLHALCKNKKHADSLIPQSEKMADCKSKDWAIRLRADLGKTETST